MHGNPRGTRFVKTGLSRTISRPSLNHFKLKVINFCDQKRKVFKA